jgi:hypothetical protein
MVEADKARQAKTPVGGEKGRAASVSEVRATGGFLLRLFQGGAALRRASTSTARVTPTVVG